MTLEQVKALDHKYYMNTFGERIELMFEGGKGCVLTGCDGKEYVDFLAGIATNSLGYNHPGLTAAIEDQLHKVVHYSNYFYVQPQAELAAAICNHSCADKVFFASTGAEANEGAFKLARKFFYDRGVERYEIISCVNSFHGRTLAALAATGQDKYRKPYTPMPQGFVNVEYGSIQAAKAAVNERTAAIIVEPIQGEGGIIEGGAEYLGALRQLCDESGILLIFDEVQCGMGRTGRLFAHQLYGVEPDIFTTAKALGNGLPISAVMCKEFCAAFTPGSHGTTLGGNALCTAAGLYIVNTMTSPGFLEEVAKKGDYFKAGLCAVAGDCAIIKEVRGRGLMLGVQLDEALPVSAVQARLREAGYITGAAGGNTLRLVPPLIIEYAQIDGLLAALKEALK